MSEVLVTEHQLSVRHACRAVGLSRTAGYRRPAARIAGQPAAYALSPAATNPGGVQLCVASLTGKLTEGLVCQLVNESCGALPDHHPTS